MIVPTPEVREAITNLQNNNNFNILVDWINTYNVVIGEQWPAIEREIDLRRRQGEVYLLKSLLEAFTYREETEVLLNKIEANPHT